MGTDIFEIWLFATVFVFALMLTSAASIQDEETTGCTAVGCAFFFIGALVLTVLLLTGVIAAW